MQYQLSEREKQILAREFVYADRNAGIIGGYCEKGFPVYYADENMASLLGYADAGELAAGIGEKVSNCMHPDDMMQLIKELGESSFYEGMTHEFTCRLRKKDGTWFWTVNEGIAVKTEDGRLAFLCSCTSMNDFIRRKHELEVRNAEKEKQEKELKQLLRSSEQRYQIISALGTAYEEICQINLLTQTYLVVSGAFEGQTGKLEELKSFFIKKNISEEYRKEAETFIDFQASAKCLKDQKILSREFRSRSGKWFRISFLVKRYGENGDVTHMLMTARNVSEQKERELEQQRLANQRLRTMTEAIHGGFKIVKYDGKGTFVKVSEQLAHMLGYDSPDEMMKMSGGYTKGIVDAKEFDCGISNSRAEIEAGEMYTMNYRIRCKDGSWKSIEERGRLICNESGEKEIWSCITDKDALVKKSEALDAAHHANIALEKKQIWTDDYNKNLLDMVKCGVLSYTVPEYKILHMNAEALRIYGVHDIAEAQKLLGKILSHTIYTDLSVIDRLKKLSEEDGAVDYECIITNPLGKRTNLLAQTEAFSTFQGEKHVVTTFLDVSESQTLRNALAASNKKNEIIGAISKLYWQVFSINLKKNTYKEVFTNKRFTLDDPKRVRVTQQDVLKSVHNFVDSSYQPRLEEFLDQSTLPQRLSNLDTISMEYQAKSGLWLSARYIAQARDNNGTVVKVLLLVQQIDEQKRKELDYQKKLEETAREAKLANEAKTNFLRRMSHDIRTPLNGILGLLKIDETHFDDPKLLQENHQKMDSSAKHLLSLLNDMLQTSKLEDGKMTLAHEVVDLQELSRNIVNIISVRAAEAGITWEYEMIKTDVPCPFYVYGSPLHLRQIFLNIYGNCIKYNRPNGKINTNIKLIEKTEHTCTYCWTISDTGIGMSEEFLKHIFEPFSQADTKVRSTYYGVGLGMSIVKGLIDQMGGNIKITSREGVGSSFEITIPFETAPVPSIEKEKNSGEEKDIRGLHILLVEDNKLNAEIAQTLLTEEGAEITTASNGQKAIETFCEASEGTFDVILMDIMMPVMDGLTAARKIRALERPDAKKIPIIAMTANAFREDEKNCLEAGMNAHLAKPLDMEKVKCVICSHVKKKA